MRQILNIPLQISIFLIYAHIIIYLYHLESMQSIPSLL